jgi:hypothetical protein
MPPHSKPGARRSVAQRMTEQSIALSHAIMRKDWAMALRMARDIQDVGWAGAFPGPAVTAGVLAMQLNDPSATGEDIDRALDEVFSEVQHAASGVGAMP